MKKILRAYIDETVDEEIIEETIEKEVTELEKKKMEEEMSESVENVDKKEDNITKSKDTVTLEKPELEKAKIVASALSEEASQEESAPSTTSTTESKPSEHNIKLTIETPKADIKETVPDKNDVVNKLTFNDTDSVVNYDKKTGEMDKPEKVEAPKTLERLEKIAHEQNEKRKAEEAEYDDEDEDDEKIQIFGDVDLNLDNMDVHNLDKKMKLEPDPILNDVEILG